MGGRVGKGQEGSTVFEAARARRGGGRGELCHHLPSLHRLAMCSPFFCADYSEGMRNLRLVWKGGSESIEEDAVICTDKEMPDIPEAKLDGIQRVKVEVAYGIVAGSSTLSFGLEMISLAGGQRRRGRS